MQNLSTKVDSQSNEIDTFKFDNESLKELHKSALMTIDELEKAGETDSKSFHASKEAKAKQEQIVKNLKVENDELQVKIGQL